MSEMSRASAVPQNPPTSGLGVARAGTDVAERLMKLSILGDYLVTCGLLVLSFWFRFHLLVGFGDAAAHDVTLQSYAGYISTGGLLMLLALAKADVYRNTVLLRFSAQAMGIFKACVLWSVAFLGVPLVLEFQPAMSRLYVGISVVVLFGGMVLWRWLFHFIIRREGTARHLRQRILIVGWGKDSEKLTKLLESDDSQPHHVVDCVAVRALKLPAAENGRMDELKGRGSDNGSAAGNGMTKPRAVGSYEEIGDILHSHNVDIVILSDPGASFQDIGRLSELCEREMVQFKVIPSYFNILLSGLRLQSISGIPIIGVSRLPQERIFNAILKRSMDIAGALVGLALSLPIMAVFGAIIYWESPGPIFYRQHRVGRQGRIFGILKLRSMKLDAEKDNLPGWTVKDDPRRLRIGAFMRRWNIDEVPQFWNVLRGDMSLVGPRPERPELIQVFRYEIRHYNARLAVRPGMTGWAQVHGLRGDTDLNERIHYDLYYLDNWSPWLDAQIMFMTFFRLKGAC